MEYETLLPIGRHELDEVFRCGTPSEAASGLLRMALHEPEAQWAEERCLAALRDPREDVVAAAVIALGHIPRIRGTIRLELVLPELKRLRDVPCFAGLLQDALADILVFACRRALAS
jgi:hypothetical protein